MTNVYEQLKDLHIRKVVVFANATDSKLYKEATFTNQLKEAELQELFKKGMLLINVGEDEYAIAAHVKDNEAYVVSASTTAAVVKYTAEAATTVAKKKTAK